MCDQVHICNTYALPNMDAIFTDQLLTVILRHCRVWAKFDTVHNAALRLLSSPFIVFPLHLASIKHWGVAIVVDAPSLLSDGPSRAIMLIIDSLPGERQFGLYSLREDHREACHALRHYLLHLANAVLGRNRIGTDIRQARVPFVSNPLNPRSRQLTAFSSDRLPAKRIGLWTLRLASRRCFLPGDVSGGSAFQRKTASTLPHILLTLFSGGTSLGVGDEIDLATAGCLGLSLASCQPRHRGVERQERVHRVRLVTRYLPSLDE